MEYKVKNNLDCTAVFTTDVPRWDPLSSNFPKPSASKAFMAVRAPSLLPRERNFLLCNNELKSSVDPGKSKQNAWFDNWLDVICGISM